MPAMFYTGSSLPGRASGVRSLRRANSTATAAVHVKASGTSLYLKIKFENEMIVKQEFQVRDLLLTC